MVLGGVRKSWPKKPRNSGCGEVNLDPVRNPAAAGKGSLLISRRNQFTLRQEIGDKDRAIVLLETAPTESENTKVEVVRKVEVSDRKTGQRKRRKASGYRINSEGGHVRTLGRRV